MTEIKAHLTHFTEAGSKRIVTIAYKWHLDGKVEYGATLWKADTKTPTYTKEMRRKSNNTAMERLNKNPVVLYVEAGKTKGHEVREKIRNAMKHMGVRGYTRHTLEDIHGKTEEYMNVTLLAAFQDAYKNVLKSGKKYEYHSVDDGFMDKNNTFQYIYRVFPSEGKHMDKRVY